MTLVAKKEAERRLSREQKATLGRFLRLRPTQQKRIFELVELYKIAATDREIEEIEDVASEILFRDPEDSVATRIEEDRAPDAEKALEQHRLYVGKQIRKWRRQLEMSQEELAKRAGIRQSHVCRLETGKHSPTYLTIQKVANALAVRPSQLDPGFED